MVKQPDKPRLKYVKFTREKGKLYAYFDTGRKKAGGGRLYAPLPAFGSAEFFPSYGAYMGARTKRQQVAPTVASVAEAYQRSDRFTRLAAGTQRAYTMSLKKVLAEFGDFPLDDITRRDVLAVLDEIPGGATRNLFVAVLGVLFKFARFRELTTADPIKDIPKAETGEHAPWPESLLKAALIADDQTVRLATHLLYFTGARIGDVVKMRWSDIQDGRIVVTPQKTKRLKKTLKIHQHERLAAELAQTPKRGMAILAKPNGRPWSQQTILQKLQAFAAEHGAGRIVAHGLRKNAVIALLEAGCTIPEVQSVTGQSVEMVMHYAAKVDQGRLSEAAILKLEKRR